MKKLILLCSFGLFGSFAFGANESVKNTTNLLVDSLFIADGYSIELEKSTEMGWPCCTATVYHNGNPVETFTECGLGSFNCMIAEAYARAFISSQGGDGWSTELPVTFLD